MLLLRLPVVLCQLPGERKGWKWSSRWYMYQGIDLILSGGLERKKNMAGSSLLKKLQLKAGQRAAIINPPAGYLDELGSLPEGVELAEHPEGSFDFVQIFAKDRSELERVLPAALQAVKY